jgi:hypothetical protein
MSVHCYVINIWLLCCCYRTTNCHCLKKKGERFRDFRKKCSEYFNSELFKHIKNKTIYHSFLSCFLHFICKGTSEYQISTVLNVKRKMKTSKFIMRSIVQSGESSGSLCWGKIDEDPDEDLLAWWSLMSAWLEKY